MGSWQRLCLFCGRRKTPEHILSMPSCSFSSNASMTYTEGLSGCLAPSTFSIFSAPGTESSQSPLPSWRTHCLRGVCFPSLLPFLPPSSQGMFNRTRTIFLQRNLARQQTFCKAYLPSSLQSNVYTSQTTYTVNIFVLTALGWFFLQSLHLSHFKIKLPFCPPRFYG